MSFPKRQAIIKPQRKFEGVVSTRCPNLTISGMKGFARDLSVTTIALSNCIQMSQIMCLEKLTYPCDDHNRALFQAVWTFK